MTIAFSLPLSPTPNAPGRTRGLPPASLTARYRPKTLAGIVGQGEVVWRLETFLEAPHSAAFLFCGGTGVGKSSTALALAAELGCAIEDEDLGGLVVIPSGEQTAETVRNVARGLSLRPLFGSGWKVVVVNEADRTSDAAAHVWLDCLENLPPRCVVVFTTNHPEKIQRRLRDRCETFPFQSSGLLLTQDAQALIDSIWEAEGMADHPPKARDIDGLIDPDGHLSFRRAVQALAPMVRGQVDRLPKGTTDESGSPGELVPEPTPEPDPEPEPSPTPEPEPDPTPEPPATLAFPAPALPKARKGKSKPAKPRPEADDDLRRKLDRLAYQFVKLQAESRAKIESLKARNAELREQLRAEQQRSR